MFNYPVPIFKGNLNRLPLFIIKTASATFLIVDDIQHLLLILTLKALTSLQGLYLS